MANGNKYLDSAGIKYLWDKAKETYVQQEYGKGLSTNDYTNAERQKVANAITEHQDISGKVDKVAGKGLSSNDYTSEEKEKLASLENYELPAASKNSLGGIKIGDGLAVDANGTVHTVYNPEMGVDWDIIENVPTTLDGYGITDAASKTDLAEVRTEIAQAAKALHYVGQVDTVADLDDIVDPQEGDMYDVREDGMNYAWSERDQRWDNLGAIVQIEALSNYELDIITGSASTEKALQDLIAEGGSVQLGQNLSLTEAITITKNVVLDLNSFTLTSSLNGYMFTADGVRLTITGGTINAVNRIAQAVNGGEIVVKTGYYASDDVAFTAIGTGSKVTFNGGRLTATQGGIGAFDAGSIEITNGTITGADNAAVFTPSESGRGGNTIIISGGELIGNVSSQGYQACGLYIANNDTVTINGGSIHANGGCGLLMRAGNVTINNCEIIATTGPNVPGRVGNDQTNMSASAVIYHESADYPGKTGMSLTIEDGTFVGDDHSVHVLSNESTPNVTINGGSFVPEI